MYTCVSLNQNPKTMEKTDRKFVVHPRLFLSREIPAKIEGALYLWAQHSNAETISQIALRIFSTFEIEVPAENPRIFHKKIRDAIDWIQEEGSHEILRAVPYMIARSVRRGIDHSCIRNQLIQLGVPLLIIDTVMLWMLH